MKMYDDEIEYREDFEGRQRLQNCVSTLQEGTMGVGFAGYKRRPPAFKIKSKRVSSYTSMISSCTSISFTILKLAFLKLRKCPYSFCALRILKSGTNF